MKQTLSRKLRGTRRSLWVLPAAILVVAQAVHGGHAAAPTAVTLVGDFQSELGCTSDSDPACTATDLTYDATDDKWTASFTIPAGSFSYRAHLDHGATAYGAKPGDGPISITGAGAAVKFYYDDATHWVGDGANSLIATLAGDFQSELGCSGDWAPDCLKSMLTDADGDGIYSFTTSALPAGSYQFKVAYDEAWTESYGHEGGANNINFRVTAASSPVTFSFNPGSHWSFLAGAAGHTTGPTSVTIPGSLQDEAGCNGDWEPDCAATHLTYDAEDDLWQGSFSLPTGSYEYKAAINDSWTVNYGRNGVPDGPNIPLTVATAGPVKFYYDEKTHFLTDSLGGGGVVAAAVGDFQTQIGCLANWDPACLRGFLADTDADGTFDVVTAPVAPGTYSLKVALNESWTVNYGDNCQADGSNIAFTVPAGPAQPIYVAYVTSTNCIRVNVGGRPRGDLKTAKAYWLDQDLIAWDLGQNPPAGATAEVRFDPNAGLSIDPVTGLAGGTAIPVTFEAGGLTGAAAARFPHLANLQVFRFASVPGSIKDILKGQVAIGLKNAGGEPLDATSLQTAGVLDAIYAAAAKPVALGASWAGSVPTLRVWAPTAQDVDLLLYADAASGTTPTEHPMTLDPATGVWSVTGDATWKGRYYVYEVTVFTRATRTVVTNLVPDPYSVDVSANSQRSHLVDLADPALKPAGWDSLAKPALASPSDIVLYELHVRDFSATDATVPDGRKGKYLAFTDDSTDGMKHLKALAQAGVTHVHLLPVFDIASVNEDDSTWTPVDYVTLRAQGPNSQDQQTYATNNAGNDGFNWGYDPLLFTAPEGSYATDPNGGARVVEFRQMVQGLNAIGLRAVMDVVYNHTSSSGQNPNSVFDKIVPGYYHRLDGSGNVERSTCCENTATEHAMMAKLTVDSLVTWAREYKVSGFRFDLMGHMPKDVIVEARDALRAIDPSIYLYGEGWNFGEVLDNKRFVQAKQADMAGTGVGTFNDRIRDATRGGHPFSVITDQGFASGLLFEPNAAAAEIGPSVQRRKLLSSMDLIRLSLTGNLKTYSMLDANGARVAGSQLAYNDVPGAGYTSEPQEAINYVSAHDNMTLFDNIQVKAAETADLDARIRYNNLALAVVMFGQGIPFFHAGDEILRSKSGDNNSYNSGDWFNRVDWSLQESTWGSGLPPRGDNLNNWPVLTPLLANAAIKPGPEQIQLAFGVFRDLLRIRKAEPLFRLRTAAEIQDQVKFHNTGATQVPGLIVMALSGNPDAALDGDLVVVFNGTPEPLSWQSVEYAGRNFALHPIQRDGTDPEVKEARFLPLTGQFTVPGRTAAVFRQEVGAAGGLPDPIQPTCSCSTSGGNAALGVLALALAALWRRRRAGPAGGALNLNLNLNRDW